MTWSKMTWYYQHSLSGILSASATASGYNVNNLLNALETDCWKGTFAGSNYIQTSNSGQSLEADYLAFTEHNLHTTQAQVSLIATDNGSFSDGVNMYVPASSYSIVSSPTTLPVARRSAGYWKNTDAVSNDVYVWALFGVTSGQTNPTNGGIRYNVNSHIWTAVKSFSSASGRLYAAFHSGPNGLYVHGGYSANSVQQDLICYNQYSDSWTTVTSTTMGPRMRHSAVMDAQTGIDGVFYFGGMTTTNTAAPLSTVWKWNTVTGSWTQVASMPAARYDTIAFRIYGGCIVVQGGYSSGDIQQYNTFLYWPLSDAWTEVACGPQSIGHTWGVANNGVTGEPRILFIGGIGSGGIAQGSWLFSGSSFNWTNAGTLYSSHGLRDGCLTQTNSGYIYYLGRQVDNSSLNLYTISYLEQPVPNYTVVVSPFIPDDDHETIQTFSLTSAKMWKLLITSSGAVAPYISIAHWGKKAEIGYLDTFTDPHEQEYKYNLNVSQAGYLQGYWELYCERKMTMKFTSQPESFYTDVIVPWWEFSRMKNFFVQWEPTEHSTEIWLMRPEPSLKAPFSIGTFRDVSISLVGRKSK